MMRSQNIRLVLIALLVIVTSLAFSPVLRNGFINYDDPGYVADNAIVRSGLSARTVEWSFTTNAQSNWHPLTWLSLAFDCTIFGPEAADLHAVNLLIHILNAILLFLVFERMTGSMWQSGFVAFVFALHPLHVESVAWISERKDVLSTLFWILSMGAYAEYAFSSKKRWYLITILLIGLGLLAKPMLVTLPFVLILLDYWPLKRLRLSDGSVGDGRGDRQLSVLQSFREKIPVFILAVAAGIITYLVQMRAGSVAPSELLPLVTRVENAIISYLRYISKTFVPVRLSIFYPHSGSPDPVWEVGGALILILGLTLIFWRLRAGHPYLIIGWLWYIGTLIPVVGFVQVGLQSMADRYMYVPMTGVMMMVAWGVPASLRRVDSGGRIVAVVASVWLIALGAGAYVQAGYWKDSITLFRHALDVTEGNHIALNNLGAALADSGKYDEALPYLEAAERILPNQSMIHFNIARSLAALGRRDEALSHYRLALGVNPWDPKLHARMADLLAEEGKSSDAAAEYRDALRLDSENAFYHAKLAGIYVDLGNLDDARRQGDTAMMLQPKNPDAHRVLGLIDLKSGKTDDAMTEFSEAVASDSADAASYNLMGLVYEQRGEWDRALSVYRLAVMHSPGDWRSHFNLGTLLGQRNDFVQSEVHLRRAAELNPGSADIHANLGKLYMVKGMNAEATQELREALRLDSGQVHALYNLGVLLFRQGKLAEADSVLARVVHLAPSYAPAVAALKQIRSLRKR